MSTGLEKGVFWQEDSAGQVHGLELVGCTQVRIELLLKADVVIERMDLRLFVDLSL